MCFILRRRLPWELWIVYQEACAVNPRSGNQASSSGESTPLEGGGMVRWFNVESTFLGGGAGRVGPLLTSRPPPSTPPPGKVGPPGEVGPLSLVGGRGGGAGVV